LARKYSLHIFDDPVAFDGNSRHHFPRMGVRRGRLLALEGDKRDVRLSLLRVQLAKMHRIGDAQHLGKKSGTLEENV